MVRISQHGSKADREPIFLNKPKPAYFLPGTVYDAAIQRIHWLFDEFDNNVSVSTSGGKDSTVVLELAAQVARERGLPPVNAHFLDQEAEYQATIEYMRYTRDRPEIDLDWYQIPFRLFNSTSHEHQWTYVWDETLDDSTWLRPKEPDSIHENRFIKRNGEKVDRFKECLQWINKERGGAILTGMRAEESPTRRIFLTNTPTYKWATWASGATPPSKRGDYYLFHPIYDWSYRDVWKSIHDRGWRYNTFYDSMFQYGFSVRSMRVSSFHHETSAKVLSFLQEIEPETWERATARVHGINSYGHTGADIYKEYTKNLPHMFQSWQEYCNYLIDNLAQGANKDAFRSLWVKAEKSLPHVPRREIAKVMAGIVMFNDVYGSNLDTWITNMRGPTQQRRWKDWQREMLAMGAWSPEEEVGRAS